MRYWLTLGLISLVACNGKDKDDDGSTPTDGVPITDTETTPSEPSPLMDVEATEDWTIPGLTGTVQVIRVEGSTPYIYAENEADLARVAGFVTARDRFFMLDLERRLAQGTVSALLGDLALPFDQESRGTGMTFVTDQILEQFENDPVLLPSMEGYTAGINAYIEQVRAGRLQPPSEYETLGPLLLGGPGDVSPLLEDWTLRDMAAVASTLTYNLGFETGDVGRSNNFDQLNGLFDGQAMGGLRNDGVLDDIWNQVNPVYDISSAPGWGPVPRSAKPAAPGSARNTAVPKVMADRLKVKLDRIEKRFGHDRESGFGSNAWAVAGSASADGRTLLAGDGHLPLSIPSLFYQIGMDTEHLGDGEIHQVGLALPGFPMLAVGTNREVAWSQTQVFGDITDWYREELTLDGDGAPTSTLFQGNQEPLVAHEESFVVANVDFLDSVGRTETWTRYTTFDGRWITEIEGREVSDVSEAANGETVVNLLGTLVVPEDLDGDGIIEAISFDYTAFDDGNISRASYEFGRASTVEEFRESTKRLVAYSQNIVVADKDGSIFYTPYQATPCREYLERNGDRSWTEGSDPSMLLDGTRYGGFTIPTVDGVIDESQAGDPYKCVVPFEAYPQNLNPPEGYVLTANNDIGNISTDGSLLDDPYWLGNSWLEGYRAYRIDELLAESVANNDATIAKMSEIQGDHKSNVGNQMLPWFLDTLERARAVAATEPDPDTSEERIKALWTANEDRFTEAEDRLTAWFDAGVPARSGVETFYSIPEADDPDHAVATMLWAAWIGEALSKTFDDEGFPGVWYPTGDSGRTRTFTRFMEGRGAGNPNDLSGWNTDTEESVFFDILGTDEVETSDEVMLLALAAGLDMLESPNEEPGYGGFGTTDMDEYLWGMRHMVKFESLLAELLGSDSGFGFLIAPFSVDTSVIELGDFPVGDPRRSLDWFPRHGDQLAVDAANPGFGGTDFTYGSGPVFRMVIALGPDGAEGVNMLPGGQSGLNDSPYFADQAEKWIANETWPLHTTIDQVLAAATHREQFTAPAE